MKLKGLRGQPLLEPPPREEELWWRMTPKDLKAIRNAVGEARRPTTEGALELVYYLKVLGWEEEVTAVDRRMIEAHLKELREKRTGTALAKMHHWMRGLGLRGRMPKGDEEIIRETSKKLDARGGPVIPEILYYMRGAGLDVEVTQPYVDRMKELLADSRRRQWAYDIARDYCTMKALGIHTEVTKDDMELMKKRLEDDRSSNSGLHRALMLYHLSQILSPPEPMQDMIAVPPLKEYKR